MFQKRGPVVKGLAIRYFKIIVLHLFHDNRQSQGRSQDFFSEAQFSKSLSTSPQPPTPLQKKTSLMKDVVTL